MKPLFITSAYGEMYAPFLLVTLESLAVSHCGCPVRIYWQDFSPAVVNALRTAFPDYVFYKTNYDLAGSAQIRIPSKLNLWHEALEAAPDGPVCLIDSDVIMRKNIISYFREMEADVLFTDKPEQFPLNTGVMLFHNGPAAKAFMRMWHTHTLALIDDEQALHIAISDKHPYGAADQMSLHLMLTYSPPRKQYEISANGLIVRLSALPCEELNETRSISITDKTHIIHYKGGWRDILLYGRNFTRNRPRKQSRDMYQLYLQTYLNAQRRLQRSGITAAREIFPLTIPFYLRPQDVTERAGMYPFWHLWSLGKQIVRRLKKIFY